MTQIWPDDTLQSFVGNWWITDSTKDYRRGRLIWAYLPYVGQTPRELVAKGRSSPTDHTRADYDIKQLRIREILKQTPLPVAAMPVFSGERLGVYKVKKRPAIILYDGGTSIPAKLLKNQPKSNYEPRILVVPAYGTDRDGSRAGTSEKILLPIRRCKYPQFFWEILPFSGSKVSIVRFDQIQPLGKHHDSVEFTENCLSSTALDFIELWLDWFLQEKAEPDGDLGEIRKELLQLPPE